MTPKTEVSVELPMANSSKFVLPKKMPPEDHSLLETVDSLVPLNYAFDDDFVGLTVGSEDSKVNGVAVAHELENSILD